MRDQHQHPVTGIITFLNLLFLAGNQLYDWQTHGVLTLMMMMSKNKH
jgi:hypothetical protein